MIVDRAGAEMFHTTVVRVSCEAQVMLLILKNSHRSSTQCLLSSARYGWQVYRFGIYWYEYILIYTGIY